MPDADDEVDEEGRGGGRKDLAGRALQVFSGPFSEFSERFRQGKRVEHIVAHPAAQRDVPAPPIVGQGCGEQRTAEILHHVDAEHARDAARDVDAAGKVAIELDAVEENARRDHGPAVWAVFQDDIVDQDRGAVCNDELFEIAPERELEARLKIRPAEIALGRQLRGELAIAADRPLNHLRKKRDEKCVFQHVFLTFLLAAVDVDDIAHRLENEKRQPERHEEIPARDVRTQRRGQQLQREIPIFHREKQAEAADCAERGDALLAALDGRFLGLIGGRFCVLPPEEQPGCPRDEDDQHQPDDVLHATREVKRQTG